MTDAEIKSALARALSATPGPWRWRGNTSAHQIELESRAFVNGWTGERVMTFERWGMQDAMPTFLDRARMVIVRASEYFVRPQPHNPWFIDGIDHPDAILIEHSRKDVEDLARAALDAREALRELVGVLREEHGGTRMDAALDFTERPSPRYFSKELLRAYDALTRAESIIELEEVTA